VWERCIISNKIEKGFIVTDQLKEFLQLFLLFLFNSKRNSVSLHPE